MKYEVLTIKKGFRYHATVMATRSKWYEKGPWFKTGLRIYTGHKDLYTGRKGLWVDHKYNLAPNEVSKLIDVRFNELFRPLFLDFLFKLLFGK